VLCLTEMGGKDRFHFGTLSRYPILTKLLIILCINTMSNCNIRSNTCTTMVRIGWRGDCGGRTDTPSNLFSLVREFHTIIWDEQDGVQREVFFEHPILQTVIHSQNGSSPFSRGSGFRAAPRTSLIAPITFSPAKERECKITTT